MLFVADSAKRKLDEIREAKAFTDDYFLRVTITSGGCSGLTYNLDFDNEMQEKDQIFNDNDTTVVCDLKSFLYLCNSTLEFSDDLEGKGFYFNNPNAARECGCGESFAL
ncbi:MAG: iron-sulfur cluster assembly accessory protein [Bacteroidota bacterium]